MSQQLMLVPTTACPAACAYCFGPHAGGPPMTAATVAAVVRWQQQLGGTEPLEITFHGGEPLAAGLDFYRQALPQLRAGLAPRPVRFAIQSNLWLLTDELAALFRDYQVALGTSLDGPEALNDAQRGSGYFRRTRAGIARAHAHGLHVGCICTFSARSAPHADQILDFFLKEGLSFSFHAAVPSWPSPAVPDDGWSLTPEAYGELLVQLLERYLTVMDQIRLPTLDALCHGLAAGHGGICTFDDCLGKYLAVAPDGELYPCQRLIGRPAYRLGAVQSAPTMAELVATPVWRAFQARQARVTEECGTCTHLAYCRGGCPYNVLVAHGGRFQGAARDPYCPAYQRIFQALTDRALAEVFSAENLAAVVAQPAAEAGLLRRGKLVQLMRAGPHPQEVARRARETVAAVALAVSASPEEALCQLDRAGLITRPELALSSLRGLRQRLDTPSQPGRLNAYLHVTYACNLACDHCYAAPQPLEVWPAMAVADVTHLIYTVREAGFRKVIITGGEPLLHPQRDALFTALSALREEVKPLQIVLRTNLTLPLSPELTAQLRRCADQMVVSVDGDAASHDARRGAGMYARTVANLRELSAAWATAQVSLAATLTAAQTAGPEGAAVRALAEELGVGVRFKPVLPLGRAAGRAVALEAYTSFEDESELLTRQADPRATCGLGLNLYIAPDGVGYPCYALVGARHALGNVLRDGLAAVLARNDTYRRVTVDSNRQCRGCALRYLCSGFCRAWGSGDDPDAPPGDCMALHQRAGAVLKGALQALEVSAERWQAAGLPWP